MTWQSDYFTSDEMKCSHCGEEHMDAAFMMKLNQLREEFAKPMTVTSAYRCEDHPIEARKTRPGAHSTGRAVDIAVDREAAFQLLDLAMDGGLFTGIGVQQKGSGRFLHLDDLDADEGYTRPTIWSY